MEEKRFLAIFSSVKVSKNGKRLVVERGDRRISLLVSQLRGILVFGKSSLSGDAINLLLSEDVPLFFLTRWGKLKGMLLSEFLPSNNNSRLRQYELFNTRREEVAKFFVLKKLEEIERVFLLELDREKELLAGAKDLDTIRGIEGNASRKMFQKVKDELSETEFTFNGRAYNPPPDEVNALLSFAYTMVYLTTLPPVVALGYDPYIGFLHAKRGTHAAFCSDVMEPVRPLITYTLVEGIKRKLFKRDDFEETLKGYRLKEEPLGRFLNWFERETPKVLEKISQTLAEFKVSFEEPQGVEIQ